MLRTRQAINDDVSYLTDVFLRAMRIHITAARGLWDEAIERRKFFEQLQLRQTEIIEQDGVNVGFFMTVERGRDVELHTLCVAPEHQRQGIGTQITRQIIKDASMRRCGVVLSVLKVNTEARTLYERLGFIVIEESSHHWRMRLASQTAADDTIRYS